MKSQISEKDLFDYVNFPDKLSNVVREKITADYQLYKTKLEFLSNLKDDKFDESLDLPLEISRNLSDSGKSALIQLEKINKNYQITNQNRLAANSETLQPVQSVQTFASHDGTLLVKVLPGKHKTKIYLISELDYENIEYELIINNGEYRFSIKSNDVPIEFEKNIDINSVMIRN